MFDPVPHRTCTTRKRTMACASPRALPADQDGLAHRRGRQTEPAPPHEYSTLAKYNDRPDEQRYQFVVMPPGQSIQTTSLRVRLRLQASLSSHLDDVPDSEFFGYDPTGFSDDEAKEGEGLFPISIPMVIPLLLLRLRKRRPRRRGWLWRRLRWWSKSPSRKGAAKARAS